MNIEPELDRLRDSVRRLNVYLRTQTSCAEKAEADVKKAEAELEEAVDLLRHIGMMGPRPGAPPWEASASTVANIRGYAGRFLSKRAAGRESGRPKG